MPLQLASNREEFRALAPLVVATLRALDTFSDEAFRIHLSVTTPGDGFLLKGILVHSLHLHSWWCR